MPHGNTPSSSISTYIIYITKTEHVWDYSLYFIVSESWCSLSCIDVLTVLLSLLIFPLVVWYITSLYFYKKNLFLFWSFYWLDLLNIFWNDLLSYDTIHILWGPVRLNIDKLLKIGYALINYLKMGWTWIVKNKKLPFSFKHAICWAVRKSP